MQLPGYKELSAPCISESKKSHIASRKKMTQFGKLPNKSIYRIDY